MTRRKSLEPEFTPHVENVLAVYNNASAANLRHGLVWYQDAHNFARILDPDNVDLAAGVIAALSPMNHWENNKVCAARVYSQGFARGTHTLPNEAKADAILSGQAPLDVLKGNKVRAFFSTILEPHGDVVPVIDRHAFDIAIGRATDDAARRVLERKGVYSLFADVYREAARIAGIGSPQMQAITWVEWREAKGIV